MHMSDIEGLVFPPKLTEKPKKEKKEKTALIPGFRNTLKKDKNKHKDSKENRRDSVASNASNSSNISEQSQPPPPPLPSHLPPQQQQLPANNNAASSMISLNELQDGLKLLAKRKPQVESLNDSISYRLDDTHRSSTASLGRPPPPPKPSDDPAGASLPRPKKPPLPPNRPLTTARPLTQSNSNPTVPSPLTQHSLSHSSATLPNTPARPLPQPTPTLPPTLPQSSSATLPNPHLGSMAGRPLPQPNPVAAPTPTPPAPAPTAEERPPRAVPPRPVPVARPSLKPRPNKPRPNTLPPKPDLPPKQPPLPLPPASPTVAVSNDDIQCISIDKTNVKEQLHPVVDTLQVLDQILKNLINLANNRESKDIGEKCSSCLGHCDELVDGISSYRDSIGPVARMKVNKHLTSVESSVNDFTTLSKNLPHIPTATDLEKMSKILKVFCTGLENLSVALPTL